MSELPSTTCPRCGAALTPGARFCAQCGAPVDGATTEERKVVTVLFADLAGSTQMAASVDPERFREIVSGFYTSCTAEIARAGGRAEKFAGDAVMAVFGLPHAHEDDATKAVHAALRIRDRVAHMSADGVRLGVRIGVNTGAVAAGSGPAGQFLVSGSAVNLAARLQSAAEADEILAGDTTHALTAHTVRYGDQRLIDAKGFESPVPAWRVDTIAAQSRRTLPMAGRRREWSLLHDTFERVRETSRPHLVTLLGEAGIGKSRLVEEFVSSLPDGTRVLAGRATEFDEDPTFSALAELLRRELGVKRETPREDVSKLLHELVEGCCDPPETDRVAARLGIVLGLADPASTNPYEVAEIRSGLLSLLEGMARDGTVTVIFEDVEIARAGFLDLVEQLIGRAKRLPLMVVCVARDALLDARPTWGGGMPDAITIRLEPLPDADAAALARSAGDDALDEADVARIAAHSGGNPFFIVETAGMLAEERREHTHDVPHTHDALLPPTVQAVIASRIDHLPAGARELVRKASVFPRATFNLTELSMVTTLDRESLERLEADDLLVRDDKRPGVWRFRHELLRDVAYETLPKRERMRLHLAVAEGLPEPERYPSVVAYHLEQAARASLDLNPNDRTLAGRAVDALQNAADIQRRRIQSRNAIEIYERALSLAGPPDLWTAREARILSGIGEARYWRGEYDEAMAALERALAVAGDDPWVGAHANRFIGDISLNVHGNLARAEWTFDEAVAAAHKHGDPWTIARTLLVAAWAPYARGDLDASRHMLQEALETSRTQDDRDRWSEARALTFLANIGTHSDSASAVLKLAEEALAIGRELDDAFTIAVAQQTLAAANRRLGRLEEAWRHADESARAFADLGAPWERASVLGDRGFVARLLGRLDEAETDLREALAICQEIKERSLGAWTASELARVLVERGELDEARAIVRRPMAQSATDELGSRVSLANTAALIAVAAGEPDVARERLIEALELERERGWPNHLALQTLAVATIAGEDAAGGAAAVAGARDRLESVEWRLALDQPARALA